LVAINDLANVETLAHLTKYDTCYGIDEKEVGFAENELIVNTHRIHFFSEKNPANLPWREFEIDVVIESTGVFLTHQTAYAHLEAGAKKVVISAPAKDEKVPTYVLGVNNEKYQGEKIISNASCTTNCIAPIMKILEDNFGIEKSMMTTVHSYTSDQVLVDGPHKDLRRARSAAENIIPTTTGAAKATALTMPKLHNKFDGLSIRVPTPIVSISDITALLKENSSIEQVNSAFEKAAEGSHKDIVVCSDEPLVSSDLIKNPASAIVDLSLTNVVDKNLAKVIAWYDNEWGYSCRLAEIVQLIGNYK